MKNNFPLEINSVNVPFEPAGVGVEPELHNYLVVSLDKRYQEVNAIRIEYNEEKELVFNYSYNKNLSGVGAVKSKKVERVSLLDALSNDDYDLKVLGHSVNLPLGRYIVSENAMEVSRLYTMNTAETTEKNIILLKSVILELKVREMIDKDFEGDIIIVEKIKINKD